jgi:large subunit ribosomal protein L6
MKQKLEEKITIPEGVSCSFSDGVLKCSKGSAEVEKKIHLPQVEVAVSANEIKLACKKGNQNQYKSIKSQIAHIKNLFNGLNEHYIYELELCHVHFPPTLKVDGKRLVVNNFFGEKNPRYAEILPNVKVEVKGPKITVSSPDKEAAGKTAANLERATYIRRRDRRIFQDGIYITSKPGANK